MWRATAHMRLALFGARYDAQKWRDAAGAPFKDCRRWHMMKDLNTRHPFVGRDRAYVDEVLGPPDPKPYLLVEQPRHRGSYIYRLGPDHLGLDSMWLVISFDGANRVRETRVVSD